MTSRPFEIQVCNTCGLRYPVEKNHQYSIRCPHCLGETKVVSQKVIHEEEMIREKVKKQNNVTFSVLLDNIRSAWNVGSIFRSADSFGFEHVHLCGITPTPENEAVKKTSLGAEAYVGWSYHKDAVKLVEKLKVTGWKIYALEEAINSKQLPVDNNQFSVVSEQKIVLIVGSEVTGVDEGLLTLCDEIFYIPMQGKKRSLNVAIAFSVAAFVLGQNS